MSLVARIRRPLFWCLAIIIGTSGVVFAVLLLFVISRFKGSATLPADCAVVFGAAVHTEFGNDGRVVGSMPGPGIERRVETAVSLYQQHQIRMLYLTGGKGDGMRQSEGDVMRDLALERGVDAKAIVVESHARSTKENILLTRPLTGSCSSVIGISDRYHLARIEFLAHQQGWELPTYPSQGNPAFLFEAQSVIREVLGIAYYGILNRFPNANE